MAEKEFKVAVFKTDAQENVLRKLLLRQDGLYGPHGGSGFSVIEKRNEKGFFQFTYRDMTPATFNVGIKGGVLWVGGLAGHILDLLMKEDVEITGLNFLKYKSHNGTTRALKKFLAKT